MKFSFTLLTLISESLVHQNVKFWHHFDLYCWSSGTVVSLCKSISLYDMSSKLYHWSMRPIQWDLENSPGSAG